VPNAGVEGLARLDDGSLLLAAERQPRALVEVAHRPGAAQVVAQAMPDSSSTSPRDARQTSPISRRGKEWSKGTCTRSCATVTSTFGSKGARGCGSKGSR
jgi:hypothetical protein